MKDKIELKMYLADNCITYNTKDGKNYTLKEPIKLVPEKATMTLEEIQELIGILLSKSIKVTLESKGE